MWSICGVVRAILSEWMCKFVVKWGSNDKTKSLVGKRVVCD